MQDALAQPIFTSIILPFSCLFSLWCLFLNDSTPPSHFPPAAVFENVHVSTETSNDLTVGSAVLPTSPLPPQSQKMGMMATVLKMAVVRERERGGGGAGCSVYKPPLPEASRNIRSPLQTVHVHTPMTWCTRRIRIIALNVHSNSPHIALLLIWEWEKKEGGKMNENGGTRGMGEGGANRGSVRHGTESWEEPRDGEMRIGQTGLRMVAHSFIISCSFRLPLKPPAAVIPPLT